METASRAELLMIYLAVRLVQACSDMDHVLDPVLAGITISTGTLSCIILLFLLPVYTLLSCSVYFVYENSWSLQLADEGHVRPPENAVTRMPETIGRGVMKKGNVTRAEASDKGNSIGCDEIELSLASAPCAKIDHYVATCLCILFKPPGNPMIHFTVTSSD
ncbi:hypothetical protein CBL_05975 [Carabus blaptoides fortunei]